VRRLPHDIANRLNDKSGFIPLNITVPLPTDYELCVRDGLCELVFGFVPSAFQNVAEFRRSSADLPPDSGDQPPVHTKTSPVPADDGLGCDDDEGLLLSRAYARSGPEELIEEFEARARMSTLQRDELLTQSQILLCAFHEALPAKAILKP
jgi:hypothetical protein